MIRRKRGGDRRGIVDLVSTYSDDDKGLIIGVLASVINHALPQSTNWPFRTANYSAVRTCSRRWRVRLRISLWRDDSRC